MDPWNSENGYPHSEVLRLEHLIKVGLLTNVSVNNATEFGYLACDIQLSYKQVRWMDVGGGGCQCHSNNEH